MTPSWRVIEGDCRDVLRSMPEQSVHTCVTSPPYFGLRDYGTGEWEGGDPACDHVAGMARQDTERETPGGRGGSFRGGEVQYRDVCGKCGARRVDRQIGLEPTPDEFVAALVDVFREVRRVLRDDGTVWLVLGDSYAATGTTRWPNTNDGYGNGYGKHGAWHGGESIRPGKGEGIKPKDLLGIPWLVAFALRADGWVLRAEVIWSKPNPMPESVTDRPTKAHEQLFVFSKAKRVGPEPTKYDDIPEGEARWLAALVDAEGSIVLRRESPGTDGSYGAHAAQLSIGGTCRALLDRIAAVVGEGSVLERLGVNAPMFYWQTSGKRAAGLLRRLYPFLVVKQRQARCVLHLEAGKAYRGGKPITRAEVDGRERLWEAVKSLNHFGDPDIAWVPEPTFGRWAPQPYFYDADAIREPLSDVAREQIAYYERNGARDGKRAKADRPGQRSHTGGIDDLGRGSRGAAMNPLGRNKRSVWTVATQPYAGAHFATFPSKLVEPMIMAGAPERACGECGAPWVRVVERIAAPPSPVRPKDQGLYQNSGMKGRVTSTIGQSRTGDTRPDGLPRTGQNRTLGFESSCSHGDGSARGIVLDPFAGAGTTGLVALQHGREFVGIELNAAYAAMARERIETAVRLGFRAPQNGQAQIDGQASIFDLDGAA